MDRSLPPRLNRKAPPPSWLVGIAVLLWLALMLLVAFTFWERQPPFRPGLGHPVNGAVYGAV